MRGNATAGTEGPEPRSTILIFEIQAVKGTPP